VLQTVLGGKSLQRLFQRLRRQRSDREVHQLHKEYTSEEMKIYIQKTLRKSLGDVRIVWKNLKALESNLASYLSLKATSDLRDFDEQRTALRYVERRWKILWSMIWSFVMNKSSLTDRKLSRHLSLLTSWYINSDKRSIRFWLVTMYQLIQTISEEFLNLNNTIVIKHLGRISDEDWNWAYYITKCYWKSQNKSGTQDWNTFFIPLLLFLSPSPRLFRVHIR